MKHYSSLWFLLFALFQFGDCIANEIQVEQIYSADEINLFDLPLATMAYFVLQEIKYCHLRTLTISRYRQLKFQTQSK